VKNWYFAGVFKNFEKGGKFFCFAGQLTEAVTGMYNLNRASQIKFPGENVLQRARAFSDDFLRERESKGTIRDKWIIAKDLLGEVINSKLAFDHHRWTESVYSSWLNYIMFLWLMISKVFNSWCVDNAKYWVDRHSGMISETVINIAPKDCSHKL
jgi:hypothetical protein